MYDSITDPLISAFDKGTLNRLHPKVFNFATSHWKNKLYRGEIEYARNVEGIIEKQIKNYDAIPYEGLLNYLDVKLMLSVFNTGPKLVLDNLKNDNRIPAHNIEHLNRQSHFFPFYTWIL